MERKNRARISTSTKKSHPRKFPEQGKSIAPEEPRKEADTISALPREDAKTTTSATKVTPIAFPREEADATTSLTKVQADIILGTKVAKVYPREEVDTTTSATKVNIKQEAEYLEKIREGGRGKELEKERADVVWEGGKGKELQEQPAKTPEKASEHHHLLFDGMKPLRRDKLDEVAAELVVPSARRKSSTKKLDPSSIKTAPMIDTQCEDSLDGINSSSNQDASLDYEESTSSSGTSSSNKWANRLNIAAGVTSTEQKTIDIVVLIGPLQQFLANFVRKGDGDQPFYPSQASAMNARNSKLFEVDFGHILSDKQYVDLALKIGNEQSHEWMHPTVLKFLKENGFKGESVDISFTKKPARVEYMQDFMRSKLCWGKYLCCSDVVFSASHHGRVGLLAGLRAVIAKHKAGISYGGI